MLRIHQNELVSKNLGQTMQHVKYLLENNQDKTIIIDENKWEELESDQFGKQAIFALYTYMYNHPEHPVYIGYYIYREDFIDPYLGWSGPKTKKFLEQHKDQTLLIDKSLFSRDGDTFGQEALNAVGSYKYNNKDAKIFYI